MGRDTKRLTKSIGMPSTLPMSFARTAELASAAALPDGTAPLPAASRGRVTRTVSRCGWRGSRQHHDTDWFCDTDVHELAVLPGTPLAAPAAAPASDNGRCSATLANTDMDGDGAGMSSDLETETGVPFAD